MDKEEIAQIVATAVGSALAQIVPVIQGIQGEVSELKSKTKTEEEDEDEDAQSFEDIKNWANATNLTKENGYNIQEV